MFANIPLDFHETLQHKQQVNEEVIHSLTEPTAHGA